VEALPVGAIDKEPVEIDRHLWVIAKRVAMEDVPAEPLTRFELPAPPSPDFEYVIRNAPAAGLGKYTRNMARIADASLGLPQDQREPFERLHESLARTFETGSTPEDRIRAFNDARAEFQKLLGEAKFQEYERLVNDNLTRLMLSH
jgi:hypothetical protein